MKETDRAVDILVRALDNIAQSYNDDYVQANAKFRVETGMAAKIVRKLNGETCDWCRALAGTYEYGKEPKEVYQRHDHCDCTVDYVNFKEKYIQNTHSKKKTDISELIKEEKVTDKRKMINEVIEDVTQKYIDAATPGIGNIIIDEKVLETDRRTTQWLHENFGGNIHCLQDTPNKGKMPDALWNGIYWEYKAPSTEGAVKDRIKSARRQIAERLKLDGRDENEKRGFVIDISNRKKTRDAMVGMIIREVNAQCHHPSDVIIVENDTVVKILRKR